MSLDTTAPRTRRALLLGAGGALAALAAQALGRPAPALGANEVVRIGGVYTNVSKVTRLRNPYNNLDVIVGRSDNAGTAVVGRSNRGPGVVGLSDTGAGVVGRIKSTRNRTREGVLGDGGTATGVRGLSDSNFGVDGFSASHVAVRGRSRSGVGVVASSGSGIGLLVEEGRIKASQVSGLAVIPAKAASVVVHPQVRVAQGSFVLLTPRAPLGGRDLWYVPDVNGNAFTIRMSTPRNQATPVAWLLLG
jgi:hypothetical protein